MSNRGVIVIESPKVWLGGDVRRPRDSQKKKFLEGLFKLTEEIGVAIDGCHCCGSPWLYMVEDFEAIAKYRVDDKAECLELLDRDGIPVTL